MKLIGVRINLAETLPNIKKTLKEEWYPFFDAYRLEENISNISDRELLGKLSQINKTLSNTERFLYTPTKEGPSISVHAIVGKNGCGKSTLLEIILRIINNLAYLTIREEERNDSAILCWSEGMSATLFFLTTNEEDSEKCCYLSCSCDKKVVIEDEIDYKFDSSINHFNQKVLNKYRIPLEHLFYSIVVNYSHYSLNTKEIYRMDDFSSIVDQQIDDMGRKLYYSDNTPAFIVRKKHWLNGLFHKNDGYLTPIVINPMRIDGNIDINREISLSRTRLMGILSIDPNFLDGYIANYYKVSFCIDKTIDKCKDQENIWEHNYRKEGSGILSKKYIYVLLEIYDLWREIFDIKSNKRNGNAYFYYTCTAKDLRYDLLYEMSFIETQIHTDLLYLAYKTISISFKYNGYSMRGPGALKGLVGKIYKTHTHVTSKVHQTINHLKYRLLNEKKQSDWKSLKGTNYFKIEAVNQNLNIDRVIERLYPPIYKMDIELSMLDTEEVVTLNTMSSGERQMLYSMSSILYHLLNLKSIKSDEFRIKYRNVNILLDEVEMYYHPEYQRQFVGKLLGLIGNLKLKKKDVCSINICIVTHSPFLLSDILRRNILFLEDGKVVNDEVEGETFGANVYDILKNGFFLKENALGYFVNQKIKLVLEYINNPNETKMTKKDAKELIDLLGDPLIRGYLSLNLR